MESVSAIRLLQVGLKRSPEFLRYLCYLFTNATVKGGERAA